MKKETHGGWSRLMRNASMLVLASTASITGTALAQTAETGSDEIVVTGSSIRGVAPVGADLITVGRDAIDRTGAQTVQQILKTIPSLSNTAGTNQGSMAGSSYYAPTIHSLGSSASSSTLVIIDGHRMPIGGTSHPLPDPSIIPPIALERVEVLADGASSTYGSDAVAGVVNFITRKNFDGVQATAQYGFGDSYDTKNVGFLWGDRWDEGSAMLAYGYSFRSNLPADARFNPDQRPRGGTNFNNFNCYPATIQPGGSSLVYTSPTATSGVANNATQFNCNSLKYSDALPQEIRHNGMVKLSHEFGEKVTGSFDAVYSDRRNLSRSARGSVNATVFNTGAQANPFYVNPPGVTATSQTIRWQADELLGPGAKDESGAIGGYISSNVEYRVNDKWNINLLGMYARDWSYSDSTGGVCGSCAFLALNGTTNSGGSLTTPSIPGTNQIVTKLPITAATALDVWNTGSANRTSAAVLADLTNSRDYQEFVNKVQQARITIDGSLFTIPGGDVKVAAGAEIVKYEEKSYNVRPLNTGPYTTGSARQDYFTDRIVQSVNGEVYVPLVSPEMEVPFIHKLDLNGAVRYDSYAVFGSTTNPKLSGNWEPVDGLRFRGSWSKSFVAPPLTSFGDERGLYAGSAYTTYGGQIAVPVSRYPDVKLLPGCAAATVTCNIGASPVQGINLLSGNHDLKPQTGKSWAVGFDLAPPSISGLKLSSTLFNAKFEGGVTSPNAGIAVNSAPLNFLLHLYPNGATPAQIAAEVGNAPIGGVLPATVYFVYNFLQRNVVNLDIQGIDMNGSWRFETPIGAITPGASWTHFTKFDQYFPGTPIFSVLGTSGYNQTFASIEDQGRANLGYENGPFSADIYANYTGTYKNWSANSVIPITLSPEGLPSGGGDPVKANVTWDFNVSYNVTEGGMFGAAQVFMDITNVFDKMPPFYNSANGFNNYAGNPVGRVTTIGLRTRF